MEQAARDRENFVGQGGETRREDDPEVVALVEGADPFEGLDREDMVEEELREGGIFAGGVLPEKEADGVAAHGDEDRTRRADRRKAERTGCRPETQGDQQDIGRNRKETRLGKGEAEERRGAPARMAPGEHPVV